MMRTKKNFRYRNVWKEKSGETLVEVVVSIFLFLMMIGIMQGAVSYSRAALEENKKIRQENAQIIENLQTVSQDSAKYQQTSKDLPFSAVNADFTQMGTTSKFTIPVQLKTVTVEYEDKNGNKATTQVCLYGTNDLSTGTGGGTP